MDITEHEVLIDVKILDIDMTCFLQLMESSYGDKSEIARAVMNIVDERGKFHNSVTGTGGTLLGAVEKIGSKYNNRNGIAEGDDIISLSSLTATPLVIKRIINIDTDMAQIHIEGKAVLFENSPVIKKTGILPDALQLAAFEAAGETSEVFQMVTLGDRVVVLGASGKLGLFCGLAAKKKLSGTGRLIGVVDEEQAAGLPEEIASIYNEIAVFDVNDVAAINQSLPNVGKYDVVINCSQRPLTEPACVMLPKQHGKVFFTNLGANSKTAGLAAEIIGKDIFMRFYHGFIENQEDIFLKIISETPDIESKLKVALENDFKYPWLAALDANKHLRRLSEGVLEEARNYVFESPKSLELLETILRVAGYDCNVLLEGETGTGKGIAAEIIHKRSKRRNGKLVKINCASIPETLLETELFGYEGGTFTGGDPKGKKGLWETANGGIIFLDEIGEMPLGLQSKLLRALEENEVFRVGGRNPIRVDVRVIAATNQALFQMVREKKFREDLYYRLNVFYLHVPPLRERREDIIPMIDMMLQKYCDKYGINKTMDRFVKKLLESFPWYGNVRELDNFIQKVFIDSMDREISVFDIKRQGEATRYVADIISEPEMETAPGQAAAIPAGTNARADNNADDAAVDEEQLLIAYKNKYVSTRKIAQAMGISQSSVVRRLKKYDIK